jgi:hypothetical protein
VPILHPELTIIPSLTRAVIAAIAVTMCVAYLSGGARGIGVSERDRVFSPADSAAIQLQLPARDVPIDRLPTISNLAGRVSLAIALGRRSALRDLAAVSTALAIAALGAWLIAIDIPLLIVALTLFCAAVSPIFWGRGISWTFDALSPALGLLALWSAARWWSTRRRVFAVVTIASGIAVTLDWRFDVVDLAAPPLLTALIDELTPLGALLAAIGLVIVVSTRAWQSLVALVWLAVAVALTPAPLRTFDGVSLAFAIGGWTAFAVALAWMVDAVPRRQGVALVTVVALMVIAEPALTRDRFWMLGRDLPSEARTRLASDIRISDLPDRAAFVADAHRADVMLRLASKLAGRDVAFLPQIPDRVRPAIEEGATVYAFDQARANLARLGFVFERGWIGDTEVSVAAGQAPCLDLKPGEWQDVSLLIASGSFVVHGSRPGDAPGGIVLRAGKHAMLVAAIEPRSIPFEVNEAAIRVPATGRRDPVIVTLASAPPTAEATAEDGPPVRLCAGVLRGPLTLGRAAGASASIRMNDSAPFAAGWHPIEADPDFFRWTAAPDALVRVSLAPPGPVRVTVTATPAARASQQPSIGLVVNSCRLAQQPMPQRQRDYEWTAGAECWRVGMNHVWISISPLISPASFFKTHDTRLLGARIGAIRLAR